jgi:uncharacterized protein
MAKSAKKQTAKTGTSRKPAKPRRRSRRSRWDWKTVVVFLLGAILATGLLVLGQRYFTQPKSQGPAKPQAQAPVQTPAKPQAQTPAQPPEQPQAPAQPPAPAPAPAPETPGKVQPMLSIVIDDLGGSLPTARDLLDLKIPITFSILPGLAHSREVDALAAKAGREVILHQPMEAWNQAADTLGPGALLTGAAPQDLAKTLAANLAQTPHAAGMNNHMGSKATENMALMGQVMTELKARGLFFLDSRTSDRSTADKEAARKGVGYLSRTLFLDTERGAQAAILQLQEAERLALTKGRAVAIGHPHPETLAALASWSVRRDTRVQLVPLARQLKGN